MAESSDGGSVGVLEGTVSVIDVPQESGPRAGYQVVVHGSDGETVAARALTDARGRYRAVLPVGEYVVYWPDARRTGSLARPITRNSVWLAAGEATRLDITVDTGIR